MEVEEDNLQRGRRIGIASKKALKFRFERTQGRLIDSRDTQWILRIFYSLKSKSDYIDQDDDIVKKLVSEIACCSQATIDMILQRDSYQIEDQRGHTQRRMIGEDMEEEIKDLITKNLQEDLDKGVPVCTNDVKAWISESNQISLSKRVLLKYLKNWGISWRRLKIDEYRKVRENVKILKIEFLKKMTDELKVCHHIRACKCIPNKKIVFLDESYIHEHHVSQFGLTLNNYPLSKPSGKGRRIVIAAAITEEGWLGGEISTDDWEADNQGIYQQGSVRCWISNLGSDYHLNFNQSNFQNYFEKCILNNLKESSIIVMDRARYHTAISDHEFNPLKVKKTELKEWLDQNNIKYKQSALKCELKLLALRHWTPPLSIVEQMAKDYGNRQFGSPHQVVFLPPYHPEYNGIELAWGQVKHFIGMNPKYKINELIQTVLPKALNNFTPNKSKSIFHHIFNRVKEDFENLENEEEAGDIEERLQQFEDQQ